MSLIAVARRYAVPLAEVAIAHNKADELDSELGVFAEMINTNRELYDLFASPVIPQPSKLEVLNAIIRHARPCDLTANLLRTLLRNYRLQYVGAVHEEFRREMNHEGIVVAKVATAAPVAEIRARVLSRTLHHIPARGSLEFKPIVLDRGG